MEKTPTYNLSKPAPQDLFDIATFNANTDIIEAALSGLDKEQGELQLLANTHVNNDDIHLAEGEREHWGEAYAKAHEHANKTILDITTAPYTVQDQNKLAGIEEGAEANVQADWAEGDDSSDSFIANKPDVYTKEETDGQIEAARGGLQEAIDAVDAKIVQADWAEASEDAGSFIRNKPDIYTKEETDTKIAEINGVDVAGLVSANVVELPADGWAGEEPPYEQTVEVAGMGEEVWPVVFGPVLDGVEDPARAELLRKQFSLIGEGRPGAGTVTFKCFKKKPTETFSIVVKGTSAGVSSGAEEIADAIAAHDASEAAHPGIRTAAEAASSHAWDVAVEAADWEDYADGSFAGITSACRAVKAADGMTPETDVSGIAFTGGDRNAAAAWAWLEPGDGQVTLYAQAKPSAAFSIRLTEAK